MNSAIYYNTFHPYSDIAHIDIDYSVCRKFDHISRYRGLRQVVHDPESFERIMTLEIQNPFTTNSEVEIYEVPRAHVNRLDLISKKLYGTSQYGWVIAYLNGIQDGYTVQEGQKLRYLKNFTDLFNDGELLASIPAMQLNLGSE